MKNQSKFKKFGTKLQAQRAIISKNRWAGASLVLSSAQRWH